MWSFADLSFMVELWALKATILNCMLSEMLYLQWHSKWLHAQSNAPLQTWQFYSVHSAWASRNGMFWKYLPALECKNVLVFPGSEAAAKRAKFEPFILLSTAQKTEAEEVFDNYGDAHTDGQARLLCSPYVLLPSFDPPTSCSHKKLLSFTTTK